MKFFGRAGAATTWVIPSAIVLWNVSQAAPHERGRVFVQEATGVVLGAVGTGVGIALGTFVLGFLALTPIGAFLLLAVAGSVVGLGLSEFGKAGAGRLYDLFAQ